MKIGSLSFSRFFTKTAGISTSMAMDIASLLFSHRVRQNHALEHAAVTVLKEMRPDLKISPRSSATSIIIFEDVDLSLLRRAMDEALRRLQTGEAELAIRRDCSTNILVGISLVTLGALFGLASNQPRDRKSVV